MCPPNPSIVITGESVVLSGSRRSSPSTSPGLYSFRRLDIVFPPCALVNLWLRHTGQPTTPTPGRGKIPARTLDLYSRRDILLTVADTKATTRRREDDHESDHRHADPLANHLRRAGHSLQGPRRPGPMRDVRPQAGAGRGIPAVLPGRPYRGHVNERGPSRRGIRREGPRPL